MYSKNRSRISAIILACRHIGIGLSVNPPFFSSPYNFNGGIDAPDFYESSFWKDSDPKSGLGGWGDPNADFSVPDGGFRTFQLSYPSPHILRRKFTLLPWKDIASFPLVTDPLKIGNASFSASVIEALLETPPGDFKGFQTVFEAAEVGSCT
jgi:tyrosinase